MPVVDITRPADPERLAWPLEPAYERMFGRPEDRCRL